MSQKLNRAQLEKLVSNAWLNLTKDELDNLKNPFESSYDAKSLLRFMANPDNFYFTCKYLFNIELHPFQLVLLKEMWIKPFPILVATRGGGKTFLLALYCMLRALFTQNSKIVIVGAGFRQSKYVFEYCERLWNMGDIYRDLIGTYGIGDIRNGPHKYADRWEMVVGESVITALPIGDGEKIRGQRATIVILDEFAAMNPDIVERVIMGFSVVSATPIEDVKTQARFRKLKELGMIDELDQETQALFSQRSNQTIIAGTASYDFNHYAKYWKRWKAIINSKGDKQKLEQIFNGEIPPATSDKDYVVFRIPVELIPPGFMDEKTISKAKATFNTSLYQLEYSSVFLTDSDGFFRRSLIEKCVTTTPVVLPSGEIQFKAAVKGNLAKLYVYGIDPASEQDNFAIVIIELNLDHRRIVYSWTTTKQKFKEKIKEGIVKDTNFYSYCARKIRDLMRVFPCARLAVDSQGGGIGLDEALHDNDKLLPGEQPIWPIIDKEKPKDTDDKEGLHILEMINFASAEWTSEANHGMKKDLEDRVLLFPFFDSVEVAFAAEEDARDGRSFDTLEDCVSEIEELKDELSTIAVTHTPSGREKWDTPEVKLPNNKKGRLRKDRYSALLMANMVARTIQRTEIIPEYRQIGGLAKTKLPIVNEMMYQGPAWFTQKMGKPGYHPGGLVERKQGRRR